MDGSVAVAGPHGMPIVCNDISKPLNRDYAANPAIFAFENLSGTTLGEDRSAETKNTSTPILIAKHRAGITLPALVSVVKHVLRAIA